MYKLKEIQQKHHLLRRGARVADIGAAPGSWSQYAASVVGAGGLIVAVDLSDMPDLEGIKNVLPVVGDIYEQSVIDRIAENGPFDAVISDAAPSTTGNRSVDTSRSAALVEHILGLCPALLCPQGSFVAKLFQGGDEQQLLAALRNSFQSARIMKPKSSRSESFEIFLVALGYNSHG